MSRDFSICTDLVSVAEQTETSGASWDPLGGNF